MTRTETKAHVEGPCQDYVGLTTNRLGVTSPSGVGKVVDVTPTGVQGPTLALDVTML